MIDTGSQPSVVFFKQLRFLEPTVISAKAEAELRVWQGRQVQVASAALMRRKWDRGNQETQAERWTENQWFKNCT